MRVNSNWHQRQRTIFLIASGLSTAGSFAGLTAKGWILMSGTQNAMLLALHFAALSLPTLLVSGPAGVRTDRIGCEKVLGQAQWALLGAGLIGALAIPLLNGKAQVSVLLLSTLLMGVAGAYELTARNKYCERSGAQRWDLHAALPSLRPRAAASYPPTYPPFKAA